MAQGSNSKFNVSVDATGTTITGGAHGISIYNAGASSVYVLADGLLSELVAAIAAGTGCIRIVSGASYAFPSMPYQAYSSLHIACATGQTATADIALV